MFAEKVTKELEVINLTFSIIFSVAIHLLQNSIHALRVLLTSVTISCCTPATGKKGLSFLL